MGLDQQLLMVAGSSSATEVAVAALAQQRATDPGVLQLAERVTQDRQGALDETMALAQSRGFTVPREPTVRDHTQLIVNLAGLSGPDFERAYVQAVVEEYQNDIDVFEGAQASVSPDVGSYVAGRLPAMYEILDLARQVQASPGTPAT
jgi:putative membrane protein